VPASTAVDEAHGDVGIAEHESHPLLVTCDLDKREPAEAIVPDFADALAQRQKPRRRIAVIGDEERQRGADRTDEPLGRGLDVVDGDAPAE
jgi:hypothetical protein